LIHQRFAFGTPRAISRRADSASPEIVVSYDDLQKCEDAPLMYLNLRSLESNFQVTKEGWLNTSRDE